MNTNYIITDLDAADYSSPFTPLTTQMMANILDDRAGTPVVFDQTAANNSISSSKPIGNSDNGNSEILAANTDWLFPNEFVSNNNEHEDFEILAQPKASYRGRYTSEVNQDKNRAKRYIRAERNAFPYDYPTVKIPSWCHANQQLYIRVTLVTVPTDKILYQYIHPYTIATLEKNTIRDEINNSLFFQINENEFVTRRKSFRIIVIKKRQDELRSDGPMRLFQNNIEHHVANMFSEDLRDPKRKISRYHLSKSQFVFTLTEKRDNSHLPVPIDHKSIKSQVMTDEAIDSHPLARNRPNETSTDEIKCIPRQGNWNGGDDMVIIMPHPIKKKEYKICFDFGQYGIRWIDEIKCIDTKTLLFQTPQCPIPLPGDEDISVSIVIQDNKKYTGSLNFSYLTPMKTTVNLSPRCQSSILCNKRPWEDENGETLISQMHQLSISQEINKSNSQTCSLNAVNEKIGRLNKYVNQLKDTLDSFVRTNNPSRLFRKSATLLLEYDGNLSPLHDAIQHGHTQIALSLIEQIIDLPSPNRLLENENEYGQTPLLVAVKCQQWKIIESILRSRSDLAKQKDKNGNNLFHLFANINEDKDVERFKNVLKILPNELKIKLLKAKNNNQQTPRDVAKSNNDTFCLQFLMNIENEFQ